MACRVIYNEDNKILRVDDNQGRESTLFKKIAKHPLVEKLEDALSIYKNKDTDKMYQKESNYSVGTRAKGKVYLSYAEALNTESKDIELGFLDNSGNFLPIRNIQPSFDTKTPKGFINTYIKDGLLSDVKEIVSGETYFQSNGQTQAGNGIYSDIIRQDALVNLGWEMYQKDGNGFKFMEREDTDVSEAQKAVMTEIKKVLRQKKDKQDNQTEFNEDELKLRLLDLLNQMGVGVMSISDYVKKYQQKNGVEPSAKALADLSNKIVAFENGDITTEELSEETAHFIVEGWDEAEIENLLRNIHKTPEWQEHSQRYREIYSKDLQGEELENTLRKEILGKVLANSFKNNFSTEETTGTFTYIIQKIKELFDGFMSIIRSRTRQQEIDQLENFTDRVNDLLYEQQLSDFLNTENFKNKHVMYSVGKEDANIKGMRVEVAQALKFLKETINTLRKDSGVGNVDSLKIKRNIQALETAENKYDISLQRQAAVDMLAVADSQSNYLLAKIKENQNNTNYTFGAEENAALQTLVHNLQPLLESIKANIQRNPKRYEGKEWNAIVSNIEEVNKKIGGLQGQSSIVHQGVIDTLVERVMLKHNLDENYREHVRQWMEAAQKDTALFHRYFGQISNSQDPMLGLASDVIERTMNRGNMEFVSKVKEWQQKLRDAGLEEQDLKQYFNEGYLLDEKDHAKIDDFFSTIRAEVRKEVTNSSDTIEEIKKKAERDELDELTPEQSNRYSRIVGERTRPIQEKYFTEKYYEDEQKKYDKLGISQETINYRKRMSADRAALINKVKNKDGEINWAALSPSDTELLENIKRERQTAKSLVDSGGKVKEGIKVAYDKTGVIGLDPSDPTSNVVEVKGIYYYIDPTKKDTEVVEARMAIDLIKLDQQYVKDLESKGRTEVPGVPPKFIQQVKEIENDKTQGKDAAIKFIEANSSIFFGRNFWEELTSNESYTTRVKEYVDNLPNGKEKIKLSGKLKSLQALNNERSFVLSQFKKNNKPHEIDETKMTRTTRETIKTLDSRIQNAYSELASEVKLEDAQTEEDVNPLYQNEVNEAYLQEVNDRNLQDRPLDEIDYAIEHSSRESRARIEAFRKNVKSYYNNKSKNTLTPSQKKFMDNYATGEGFTKESLSDQIAYTTRDFARTQVASYFKRLVPAEYTDVFLTKENGTAVEYLDELIKAEHVEVVPNYSFLEQEDVEYKNPNYKSDYEGGMQVKGGNIKYQKPVTDENGNFVYDDGVLRTTEQTINFESQKYKELIKSEKFKKGLDLVKELQRETLKNYGIEGNHSLFKLPQITKKGIDRVADFMQRANKGGIGQTLEELFKYRVDDLEYGETVGSNSVSVIPTYYTRNIENKEELSDELFFSYAAMYQQSVLHKHRKKNIGEMLAIKDAIEKRESAGNRKVDAANTVSMFNNYMDYGFFGQNETKEFKKTIFGKTFDLTKIARNLLNFVKFRNLGFSPIVAATSYMTAEINIQIEKQVKELMNPSSERLGRKVWSKLAKDAMGEIGKKQSKSKLNILGEFFNIYNTQDRFDSSNYGWFGRNLNPQTMGYAIHQISNFPISPRAMLAVLHDQRVVDGKIINFSNFKKKARKENPEVSIKDIEAEWAKTEDNAVYNYLDIDINGVRFNESILSELSEDINKEDYLAEKMDAITGQVKNVVTQLDGQISESQRIAAQRHFAMNYLMTHRSWLSIAISKRTKNGHYNLMSGEYEEGTYVSFWKMLEQGSVDMVKEKNLKSFLKAWRGEGLSQEEQQVRRRNLRRVALDTAFFTAVAGLTYALVKAADDDEDNYLAQFSSYLMLRTLNEQASTQGGLAYQAYETIEAPFVGLNTVRDMINLPIDAFDSEKIKSGRYKGETKSARAFKKVVPGLKTIDDMTKLKQTRDTYYFYNSTNLKFNPVGAMFVAGLDEN